MEDILIHESQHVGHKHGGSFILAILSHGNKGIVMGTDGEKLDIEKLKIIFDGIFCPNLRGKPKLFLMQACQGSKLIFFTN